MLSAKILSALLFVAAATAQAVAPVFVSLVCPTVSGLLTEVLVQAQHPLVINGAPNGIFAYAYSNNSLLELRSAGGPGNTAPLNTWAVSHTPAAMAALGITNVTPSTYIAGYGYLTVQSSLDALAMRIFYQTTNGNIVSAYHSGLTGSAVWVVDTTLATGLPLGTPITAFITVVESSRIVCSRSHCDSRSESSFRPFAASGGSSVHGCQRTPHLYLLDFGCGGMEHPPHDPGLIVECG